MNRLNFRERLTASLMIGVMCAAAVWLFADTVTRGIADNVIRLHITAAGDDAQQQRIKLAVRDEILKKYALPLSEGGTKAEAEASIKNNLSAIADTANAVLMKNHASYAATAEYGRFDFPQKTYDGLILPAGQYDGVRITLGSGEGHNWWCVMFPNMCVPCAGGIATKEEALSRADLPEKSREMLSDGNDDIVLRLYLFDRFAHRDETLR